MQIKIDIIVTQHLPLVRYLRELGLADDTTPVIEHATVGDVKDRHVAGVLPVAMAAYCASYTEIPMALTPADRHALRQGDLSYERMREIAGEPTTYWISTERPWACSRVFQRAVESVCLPVQGTYHINGCAQGTLELVSSGGDFSHAQIDLYGDRYRTHGMGPYEEPWSPWLDADGQRHRDQADWMMGKFMEWLKKADATLADTATLDQIEIWDREGFLAGGPVRVERLNGTTSAPGKVMVRDLGPGHHFVIPAATPCKVLARGDERIADAKARAVR